MATQNAKIDSNYHKSLLAVDETTGETRRLQSNSSGALKVTGTATISNNTSTQKIIVSKAGITVGTRQQLNLIEGSNVTLTVSDNSGSDRVDVTIASTASGAPADAQYVTLATNGTLTNERVLTGTSNQITVTDNGAGSTVVLSTPQNIATTSTPQFARLGLGQAADSGAVMAATGQYFSTRYSAGNSSTAITLDFNNGNVQFVTMTGNCTFTLSNPKSGGRYILELLQDGTGSRTATWPATVKWSGGTTPTLTTTAGRTDIITLYWNGTSYVGSSTLNYSL